MKRTIVLLAAAAAALTTAASASAHELGRPPHLKAFLCIHRFEGSWQDTGSPYWGGLQMDRSFMNTYAEALHEVAHVPNYYRTKGTADHWTPKEQMWVAEMAVKTRGFGPWPVTRRRCGV